MGSDFRHIPGAMSRMGDKLVGHDDLLPVLSIHKGHSLAVIWGASWGLGEPRAPG